VFLLFASSIGLVLLSSSVLRRILHGFSTGNAFRLWKNTCCFEPTTLTTLLYLSLIEVTKYLHSLNTCNTMNTLMLLLHDLFIQWMRYHIVIDKRGNPAFHSCTFVKNCIIYYIMWVWVWVCINIQPDDKKRKEEKKQYKTIICPFNGVCKNILVITNHSHNKQNYPWITPFH
jgi:hypothetical protein